MKNQIVIKTSQGEMDFSYLCNLQFKKVNHLMNLIESEFNTTMDEHEELRHEILDISGFIKRIPQAISECVGD